MKETRFDLGFLGSKHYKIQNYGKQNNKKSG